MPVCSRLACYRLLPRGQHTVEDFARGVLGSALDKTTLAGLVQGFRETDVLGRLGGRHETLRAFYLTLITALGTLLGLTSATGPLGDVRNPVQAAIGAAGVLLALIWSVHMKSFGTYFAVKKEVLAELEAGWSLRPFVKEIAKLKTKKRWYRVTYVDQLVAAIFLAFFFYVVVTRWPT